MTNSGSQPPTLLTPSGGEVPVPAEARHPGVRRDDGAMCGAVYGAWQRAAAARLSGPARFAQALLARHGQGVRRTPRIDMLLALRKRTQITVLQSAGDTQLHIAMTLPAAHARIEPSAAPLGRSDHDFALPAVWPQQPRILAPQPSASTPPVPSASATPAMAVLRRALSRGTRLDALPTASAAAAQALPVAAPTSVARAAPARLPDDLPTAKPRPASVPMRAEPEAASPSDVARLASTAVRAAPTQALPPHEIERITEQVLGGIDRRILAERERLGRF